jgi:hypothetical protein
MGLSSTPAGAIDYLKFPVTSRDSASSRPRTSVSVRSREIFQSLRAPGDRGGGRWRDRGSGFGTALGDLVGARCRCRARKLQRDLEERLRKAPARLNEFGFDPYGMSIESWRRMLLPIVLLYRYYFRVETSGIERLPQGRVLVVANHAGQLPFDAAMLGVALLLEAEPPRIARAMGEYWIPNLPWVSIAAARVGALVGTPSNCTHMLENGGASPSSRKAFAA